MFNLLEKKNTTPVRTRNANNPLMVDNIVALYERLSCDDDLQGESNSITNQKAFLENYAKENGFGTNIRHYTDDGYSGGSFDRPGWKQLIEDIEAGSVKTVLVKDMSRVGRNYIETGYYTEFYFADMGVRFIAVNNGIDNANPDSTEFAGILNIMNDWYLRDQSKKIRLAAQQKGKSGKSLAANLCFGYMRDPNDKNHWIVDPEAADTVRRIFELAASGISQLNICRTLGRERRYTPGYYRSLKNPNGFGKQYAGNQPYHWRKQSITAIVRRREYLGETVNFKTSCPEYRSKKILNPPEKRMTFLGSHEAIVTPEVWQAAQRIFHPEMSSATGKPGEYNGLIYCGECGAPMLFHRYAKHEKDNDYICRTHKYSAAYEQQLCTHNSIRITTLSRIVKDVIQNVSRYAITDEKRFRRALEKEAQTSKPNEQKKLAKLVRTKEKRIAELEHLLKKLYEDYALGRISEERFDKLSQSYEQEETEIKEILTDLQSELDNASSEANRIDQFLALARKYQDCTELIDEMIHAFVEKIVVYRTIRPAPGQRTRRIEVHLNFIGQFSIPMDRMENQNE